MQERSIALYIVLTVVTCGLFGIYWYYTIASDIYYLHNNVPTTPGVTILLNIITCGIYGVYVYYMWGKAMNIVGTQRGRFIEDNSVLYLVLSILGLPIVNMGILQSQLNGLVTGR